MIVKKVLAYVTRKQEIMVCYDDTRSVADIAVLKDLSDEPIVEEIVEYSCIELDEDDFVFSIEG